MIVLNENMKHITKDKQITDIRMQFCVVKCHDIDFADSTEFAT